MWIMVERRRGPAVYTQIADEIHTQIAEGTLAPGDPVPSGDLICRTYGVGMGTAERALRLLTWRGLIEAESGIVARVRTPQERETVRLRPGADVESRWPTPAEADRMGIRLGVPVLVVTYGGGEPEVYPADRYRLTSA